MREDKRLLPAIKLETGGGLFFSSVFPTISLIVFLLLLFVVAKIGWSKISEQRRTISDLKTENLVLNEKKERLERLSKDLVPLFFNISSSFLPVKSPILISLSTVKKFLAEYLLPVESFTISISNSSPAVDSSQLTVSDSIRLELVGDFEQISLFLKRIEEVIPLMAIKDISLSSEGDVLSAEIEVKSFWSPYKEAQVAELKAPLPQLSESERFVLDRLSKMERAGLEQEVYPSGPYNRASPFSQ